MKRVFDVYVEAVLSEVIDPGVFPGLVYRTFDVEGNTLKASINAPCGEGLVIELSATDDMEVALGDTAIARLPALADLLFRVDRQIDPNVRERLLTE